MAKQKRGEVTMPCVWRGLRRELRALVWLHVLPMGNGGEMSAIAVLNELRKLARYLPAGAIASSGQAHGIKHGSCHVDPLPLYQCSAADIKKNPTKPPPKLPPMWVLLHIVLPLMKIQRCQKILLHNGLYCSAWKLLNKYIVLTEYICDSDVLQVTET